jgi:superfamily II DNA/RNA helicase
VHIDPPQDPKDYLHRAGRTARAGESGAVATLVLPKQRRSMQLILQKAGVRNAAEYRVRLGDPKLIELAGAREPSGTPVVDEPRREAKPRSGNRFGDRPRRDSGRRTGFGDRDTPGRKDFAPRHSTERPHDRDAAPRNDFGDGQRRDFREDRPRRSAGERHTFGGRTHGRFGDRRG